MCDVCWPQGSEQHYINHVDGIIAIVFVGLSASTTRPSPTTPIMEGSPTSPSPTTGIVTDNMPIVMIVIIVLVVVVMMIIIIVVGGVVIRYNCGKEKETKTIYSASVACTSN